MEMRPEFYVYAALLLGMFIGFLVSDYCGGNNG